MPAAGLSIFLPESIGMLLAVLVYFASTKQLSALRESLSWYQGTSGVIFAAAAVAYIFSVRINGVNTAFVISQLLMAISTLGGILVLHEHRTRKEMRFTLLGLLLIIAGAISTTIF